MSNPLEYNAGPDDGTFRINASSFSTFMDRPWQWYREKVLGEDGFEGNESSIIGTICHYCAELKAKGLEPNRVTIDEYIDLQKAKLPELDANIIREAWPPMAMTLVNDYVLPNTNNMHEVEPYCTLDLGDDIVAGGSIDRVENVGNGTFRIVDYKTYNSKVKPKVIPMYYKYQLLIYAAAYGNVSEIRLVYINRPIDGGVSEKTGKPLKSYPSEVTVLTEQITQEDIDFIKGLLNLCKDTLLVSREHPELNYILWRDPRLKDA